MKCLKIDGKSCLNLLGKQVRRKFTLDEQTIIENCLFQQNDEDIDENDHEHIISIIEKNSCVLYQRLEFRNGSNSIFTTAAYVRSKKRINYCALLQDGSFFSIENFIFIEEGKCDFQRGKNLQLYLAKLQNCQDWVPWKQSFIIKSTFCFREERDDACHHGTATHASSPNYQRSSS
ncbi:hypothetical protein OUZ56_012442 [Daphnia magna]|uniref:Uncharacterized protein n=1 Tax=Daphnia magna TaxID=35525 RepID=A0ABQ9Z307_9CRUS|nr:hypothetical protein OUZ56_012442 [Daphnia magna]